MFLSSSPSPTLTGSSSTFHGRSFHASSRRNFPSNSPSPRLSQTPQSPRFQTPLSAPRRADGPTSATHSKDAGAARVTDDALASPKPEAKAVDAGTQYSPVGYPPTYRPPQAALAPYRKDRAKSLAIEQDAPRRRPSESDRKATAEPTEPIDSTSQLTQTHDPKVEGLHPPSMTSALAESLSRSSVADDEAQPSPSKKPRQQDPAEKVMPLKYELCDVKDLGVLISDMLMELVRLNDKIPLKDGQLTRFHSRAPPGISVRDYLSRLIIHATLSPPILLSMVYYVDRLCALYPAFTISSLTVHRFLITAATVAAKGLSDSFWTNSTYARVGGVSTKELALLELEFLRRLEWRIVPKPEVLVDYYRGLVERGQGYMMEEEEPPKIKQEGKPDQQGETST